MPGYERTVFRPAIMTGEVAKEVSYSILLSWEKEKADAIYTFKKKREKDKEFTEVQNTDDLFQLDPENDQLQLCIEENVGWLGKTEDKCEFIKKKRLKKYIDVYLPLKIVIVKRERKSVSDFTIEKDLAGQEMLHVLIEVIDPPEEIDVIKGPRGKGGSRTGKDFVKSLTHSYVGGDNCYGDLVPSVFRKASRSIRDEGALSLVYDQSRNLLKEYPRSGGRPQAIIPVRTRETWGTKSEMVGVVKVYFNPPPIAGDNYRIKISLVERDRGLYKKVQLKREKDGTLENVDCFETPTMTIWKKVKLEMLAVQEGVQPEKVVLWDEVKGAFRDAFIEFEKPKEIIEIRNKKWMKYLWRAVYRGGWHTKAWKSYRKTQRWKKDLKEYSFPQRPELIPPRKNKKNPNNTVWKFLEKITYAIIADWSKLKKKKGKLWRAKDVKSGFLALICKRPSEETGGLGMALPRKVFYLVMGEDDTGTLVHELGHALFLNHGSTDFVYPPISNKSFIRTASDGPFWDEHDSEDMISCVMSYKNEYYVAEVTFDFAPGASDERIYKPLPYTKRVDWHFCGLCLLKLRLYDIKSSLKSKSGDDLRKILYKELPKIAWGKIVQRETEEKDPKKKKLVFSLEVYDQDDDEPPILHPPMKKKKPEKKKGKKKKGVPPKYSFYPLNKSRLWLLALYPPEKDMAGIPVINNLEKAFWKDVSVSERARACAQRFPRGRWRSTNRKVAVVKERRFGDRWTAFVQAKRLPPKVKEAETKISYQILRGVSWKDTANVKESKPIKIVVKRRETKKERDETVPRLRPPGLDLKVNEKNDS